MPPSPWTDQTLMPWGKHKGSKLVDIPPAYLLWLFEQTWIKDYPGLHAYLKKNEDLLMSEKNEDRSFSPDDDSFRDFDDYKNYRGN